MAYPDIIFNWARRVVSGPPPRFTLACVIDQHPRFYTELILWALCARQYLPAHGYRMMVYFMKSAPPDLVDWLRHQGISSRLLENPVVPASPHCNKIAPFMDAHDSDYTIVCDADLFFVDDPAGLFTSDRFRAAPNNHCNPPPHIFRAILAESGLGRPYRPGISLFTGVGGMRETHITNISAGIVAVPLNHRVLFAGLWKKWAHWLVDHRALLDRWAVMVDQVAFALAMEELGQDVEFLPPQVNTILHLLPEIDAVYAFHLTSGHIPEFHRLFRPDRTMVSDGFSKGVAAAVGRLNEMIAVAVSDIKALPSTRDHLDTFLNPDWKR